MTIIDDALKALFSKHRIFCSEADFQFSLAWEIQKLCKECDVEFELIAKLIIEIEENKNYTRSSMVTKAFDKIINQGWLHFNSIEKGLQYEN